MVRRIRRKVSVGEIPNCKLKSEKWVASWRESRRYIIGVGTQVCRCGGMFGRNSEDYLATPRVDTNSYGLSAKPVLYWA